MKKIKNGQLIIDIDNLGLFINTIASKFPRMKNFANIAKNFTKNVIIPEEIQGEDINEFINKRLAL